MSETTYQLLKLNQTNRYSGYQFVSRVRIDGLSDRDVFYYLVLKVYEWIIEKVPEEDKKAPELQVPVPEEYASATDDLFKSHHLNIGFALDITPLMKDGIWALRIKETDSGTSDREAVNGRFFTTRVGVRLNEKGYSELAVKIDVTDPASVEEELPFAFRPGFIRRLGKTEGVHFEQIVELKYGKPYKVETEDDYRKLLYLLDSEDNQTPVAVFTYARPGEVKPSAKMSMEEFVKNDQLKSFLQSPGMPLPGMGFPGVKPMPAAPAPVKKDLPPVLPYDTVAFSKKTFAFAVTYELGEKFTEKFRNRIKKDFRSGDVLLFGAKKFRGGVDVFGYPGENEKDRTRTFDEAILAAESYSKHKAPYDYGATVFEAVARRLEQQARIDDLINSKSVTDKDKIGRLQYELQIYYDVIHDRDEAIRELQAQKEEAFERGLAAGENEIKKLKDDISALKSDLASKQATIDHMQSSFQQVELINEALQKVQTIDELPETNEDVVTYFRTVYWDRIDFTDRGISTASKCDLRPSTVWDILYRVANPLVDLFRNVSENLSEQEVTDATGFEISFREGAETRGKREMMRLREDVYNGKDISIEPHLKLKSGKGEPVKQRLHFWFDPENQRIVVGHLGDHLDSASSRYVK